MGVEDDLAYIDLELRPAYHDLSDLIDGYPAGSELRFFPLKFRYFTENGEFNIEEFTAIEIISLSPRDDFFKPISWKVAVGARRLKRENARLLTAYLQGGAGMVYKLGDSLVFGFADAILESHRSFSHNVAFGPAINLGWSRQKSQWQSLLTLEHQNLLLGEKDRRNRVEFWQGLRLADNQQIGLNLRYERNRSIEYNELSLTYRFYF